MKIYSPWKHFKSYVSVHIGKTLINSIGVSPKNSIYSCKEFRVIIERERKRANRNGCYGFSLVVFEAENAEANGSCSKRLINVLHCRRLRASDEIGWFDRKRIGVLLHGTGKEGAWQFISHIRDAFPATYHPPDCKVYIYPFEFSERIPIASNKRKSERFYIQTKCLISVNDDGRNKAVNELLITNISTGGVFLQTNNPLPINTKVNLNIVHSLNGESEPDRKDNTTKKVAGSILRIDKRGMVVSLDENYPVELLRSHLQVRKNNIC